MLFIITIAFVFLFFASIYDLRTGEVPDSVSVGYSGATILLSLVYSLKLASSAILFETLLIGAGYFFIGYIIFRLGQWGGGDVKILAGIGCTLGLLNVLGFGWPNSIFFPYWVTYYVNMATVAAPYVIAYGIILGLKNPNAFERFKKQIVKKQMIAVLILTVVPIIVATTLEYKTLTIAYASIPLFFIFSVYLKCVEHVALKKTINVADLCQGDILAEDVAVENVKKVSGKNIEGITAEDLKLIRDLAKEGKIPTTIVIRWGIKFVPIFLIALIISTYFGNFLELFFGFLIL